MSIQSYLQNSDTLPGFAIDYMGPKDDASGIKTGDSTDLVTQKLLHYISTIPINPSGIKALFSGTPPLSYDLVNGIFAMAKATGLADGYLTKEDFASFNGKLSGLASQTGSGQDIYAGVAAGVAKIKKINGTGSAAVTSDGNVITVNVGAIPSQVNLIPGANVTITGTYPDLTIAATGGGSAYSSAYSTLF